MARRIAPPRLQANVDARKKPKKITKKTKALKARFDAAHAKGMKALKRHDYDAVGDIIAEEAQIIEAQRASIEERRRVADMLSRQIADLLKSGKKTQKRR